MKKIISAVAFATVATGAWAQVPELGDVLGELSTTELDAFNDSLVEAPSVITEDLEVTLDLVLVNDALDQGFINESEAEDLETALGIIEANEDFFDFDLQGLLSQLLQAGFITAEEIADTLQVFDTLSDSDKSIVGSESFVLYSATCTDVGAGLSDCGPAGKANSDLSTPAFNALKTTDAFALDEKIALVDAAYDFCGAQDGGCSETDVAHINAYINANNLAPAFGE